MIKKVISLLLLLIGVGFVGVFAFPEQTKNIADKFGLGGLFTQITNTKKNLDNAVRNSEEIMDNVTKKVTNTQEELKKKALEIKEKTQQQAQNILNTK